MGSGKTWNTVQRQRFGADEVDAVLEEVRSLLRERGRSRTQWEVGSAAEPDDLVDRLLARGLIHDRDPYAVALVLTTAPPAPLPELVARRVETFDEYAAANEVQWHAFEMPEDEIADCGLVSPSVGRETVNVMHAVWLDGEIVSTGTASATEHGLPFLRRRYRGARARPRRLPRASVRPLGRSCRARHARAHHAGRLDVAADPRAPRLRAGRRGPHAPRRLRRARGASLPTDLPRTIVSDGCNACRVPACRMPACGAMRRWTGVIRPGSARAAASSSAVAKESAVMSDERRKRAPTGVPKKTAGRRRSAARSPRRPLTKNGARATNAAAAATAANATAARNSVVRLPRLGEF